MSTTIHLRTRLLIALLAIAASSCAGAETYTWRSVKVGGGGFIPGIVFSRVQRGLAYLRSDMGGCYRWDDAAKTWIPMHDQLAESSYFGGESIAPDPIDADTVYIAAGMYRTDPAAILRSHDRGKTWQIFPVPFRMGGNEDGRGLGERLAVDPNDNRILYFGSRHDGLQRSSDRGETWAKVESFPVKGRGLPPRDQPTNAGLSFVVFDPTPAHRGEPTRTIFVGVADPGEHHLFRSDDAGATWNIVPGEPKRELLPAKAEIDDAGVLYITYANGPGPNGVTDGAVMKLDTHSGAWTDITPDKRAQRPKGGYMGLSLDRQRPGTLGVTTMNRWSPMDTVWRSTDGGATWRDILGRSERDVRATPFLLWGNKEPKLGWWMAAFAIDPFDSDHAAYATGATVYATNDFSKVNDDGATTHWRPWVQGIEQTAIITLCSPTGGAHLLSGFGDIGGFVHDDLAQSPNDMYENPQFGNTNTIDFAELAPNVIVRSGRPNEGQADLGYSDDFGKSWHPLAISRPLPTTMPPRRRGARPTNPAIVVSAEGATFIVMTSPPRLTRDRGKTWSDVQGLPTGLRVIADRQDPRAFYALDFATAKLYVSSDGGASFTPIEPTGLPTGLKQDEPTWHEAPLPLVGMLGRRGDLWLVSKSGLFHSTDAGHSFSRIDTTLKIDAISFGKPPPSADYPTIFAIATDRGVKAIWRSTDVAQSWQRINDDQHEYGTRFRCLAGDPRVFGRVYVGTDGRGIIYGEPSSQEK